MSAKKKTSDKAKTKQQLIDEMEKLRCQIAELETTADEENRVTEEQTCIAKELGLPDITESKKDPLDLKGKHFLPVMTVCDDIAGMIFACRFDEVGIDIPFGNFIPAELEILDPGGALLDPALGQRGHDIQVMIVLLLFFQP